MLEVRKTWNMVQMMLKGLDSMMQVVAEGLDILLEQTSPIHSLRYSLRYSVLPLIFTSKFKFIAVISKMLKLDAFQIFEEEMDQFAPDIQVNTIFSLEFLLASYFNFQLK